MRGGGVPGSPNEALVPAGDRARVGWRNPGSWNYTDTGTGPMAPYLPQPTLCCPPAERVLRLVDCASGAMQDFAGHDDSVQLCRFAPSARLLFTAAHSEILVWEVTGH